MGYQFTKTLGVVPALFESRPNIPTLRPVAIDGEKMATQGRDSRYEYSNDGLILLAFQNIRTYLC